jgi:hypothetical protein
MLDVGFVIARATRDRDEGIEVSSRFKGGAEWIEGLTDSWTEVVRSTYLARGLIALLSLGEST